MHFQARPMLNWVVLLRAAPWAQPSGASAQAQAPTGGPPAAPPAARLGSHAAL